MNHLQRWIKNIDIQDPIEREQAFLLRIMMIALGTAAIVVIPLEFAALPIADALRAATTSVITIISLGISIWILRKNHLRLAVLTLCSLMIAGFANNLFAVGIRGNSGLLFAFIMPITLAGLLTGRRGILVIAGLSMCVVTVIGILEGTTTGIIGQHPRQSSLLIAVGTFIVATLVVTFLFYSFSATLRHAVTRTIKSEEKYRSIFENASEGIFQSTHEGKLLSANPALARIYGYESAAAMIEDTTDLGRQFYVDPGRRALLLAHLAEHNTIIDFESQIYRRDGEIIWIAENIRAVRDDKGHLLHYEGKIEDITRRKQLDLELASHREHLEQLVELRTTALTEINSQLHLLATELQAKNERFQQEMELAHTIQSSLLPKQPPWATTALSVVGLSIPASEVGGDFYTYIGFREQNQIGVLIGDISGKGIGAALMMALVLSAVEAQARATQQPHQLLRNLNRSLLSHLKSNHMNAGLMYVWIDLDSEILRVANAGMVAPYLIRAGRPHMIEVYGLPIGVMGAISYQETEVQLQAGDLLVLVSDGIVEAHSASGELFGFERLERMLGAQGPTPNPARLVHDLMQSTETFMGATTQHDDMTIVTILFDPALLHSQPANPDAPSEAGVVIIDDSVDNIFLMQSCLLDVAEVKHCMVHTSASQFLEWCSAGIDRPIDLILLDIKMPYEDGFTVVKKLRTIPGIADARIIAVTSYTDSEHVRLAQTAGFDGFIGKPLDFHRFPNQIQRILEGEILWEPG